MRKSFVALGLLLTPTLSMAFDDQAITEKCDAEWGTDYSMVKYCRDEQRKAGTMVDELRSAAENNGNIMTILKTCEDEWATDYTMVAYCYDQQMQALVSLGNKPADVPQNIRDIIAGQCVAEWDTDYVMVAYCIDQQVAAWRELQ